MAAISASMVKELRDKTGVGMMDCKRALESSGGDMEGAIDSLRKAGIAKAEKRAGRTAKEGRIVAVGNSEVTVLTELLSETDFVAKTDDFASFATTVAESALSDFSDDGDISEAVAASFQVRLTELIGKIGENMQIRRTVRWAAKGKIAVYLHMGGRIAAMVDVEGDADDVLLKDICMHITAFSPQFISPEDVPAEVIDKEKEIAAAQVEGKPANIIEKIVMGKINKWYTETCLARQPWIRDDKVCLAKVAPKIKVLRFLRWQVGEEG